MDKEYFKWLLSPTAAAGGGFGLLTILGSVVSQFMVGDARWGAGIALFAGAIVWVTKIIHAVDATAKATTEQRDDQRQWRSEWGRRVDRTEGLLLENGRIQAVQGEQLARLDGKVDVLSTVVHSAFEKIDKHDERITDVEKHLKK